MVALLWTLHYLFPFPGFSRQQFDTLSVDKTHDKPAGVSLYKCIMYYFCSFIFSSYFPLLIRVMQQYSVAYVCALTHT